MNFSKNKSCYMYFLEVFSTDFGLLVKLDGARVFVLANQDANDFFWSSYWIRSWRFSISCIWWSSLSIFKMNHCIRCWCTAWSIIILNVHGFKWFWNLQIPHLRPAEYKRSRLARNRRTVNRAYGGVLSGSAVRERLVSLKNSPVFLLIGDQYRSGILIHPDVML